MTPPPKSLKAQMEEMLGPLQFDAELRQAAWEQMRERMNSPAAVALHRLEAFPQRPIFVESNPSLVTAVEYAFARPRDPEVRWMGWDEGEVLTESPPCEMFSSPREPRYSVIPEKGNRKARRRAAAKNRKTR